MPGRVLWQTLKRRAMIEIPMVLEQGQDICNRDLHTIQKTAPAYYWVLVKMVSVTTRYR